MGSEFLEEIKRIKAIADIGLQYASSGYELERYTELQEISYRLLSKISGHSIESLRVNLPTPIDYPTAKVDIRGLLIHNDNILLVKESADSRWSLPGGWADVGHSPAEIIVKEFKEETGLDVQVKSLLAVFDKSKHPHPPESSYVYKLVFHCTLTGGEFNTGFDVLDVNYFDMNNLPPLSENRIIQQQIALVYEKVKNNDLVTYFD